MVVVVTAIFCGPFTGLPLLLEATPMAIAVTTPTPRRTQPVVPIFIAWACLTPAGLPVASGLTSAAKAVEAIKVVDKATAINVRMVPLGYSFLPLYTKVQQTQCAGNTHGHRVAIARGKKHRPSGQLSQ